MKRIMMFGILCILFCCGKNKSVQLPEIDQSDITELNDISATYLFYDKTKKDSVEFNKKNLISTTHWLVNIDKRLTLKQILPHLKHLQNKRTKAGLHKNEAAKNYFTCHDTSIKSLGFIEFTDIVYHDEEFKAFIKKPINSNTILIRFTKDSIFINKNNVVSENFNSYLNSIVKDESNLYLNFNSNMSFQDYITYKSLLLKLNLSNDSIENDEFIY